jgi:hypothetical protein
MKAYRGSEGIAPPILGIDTRRCQLHAPATLPPGKEPPVTHWIGGWVGRSAGEEKISQPTPGLEPPIIQPVAQSLYHWAIQAP